MQVGDQFRFAGPALEVQAQHLKSSLVRLLASPLYDQQTGDQCQVDLDGHAILTGGQEMLAAQDALEPAKKQLHRPAKLVSQSDPGGVEVQAVARQQEDFRLATAVLFPRCHFDDTKLLLENRATQFTAEPDDAVADNAGL